MIARYQRQIMADVWSEENRFKSLFKVEVAASYAWMKLGLFDESVFKEIEQATYDIEEIKTLEKETKHDIIAFTRNISNRMKSDAKKWIHYGLTSTDVVDTAYALQFKEANDILEQDILSFMATLKRLAYSYKDTLCIGRTHGMHADLTSFGFKFALYYDEMKRNYERFVMARKTIEVGKISGAVGNFANVDPMVETIVCESLQINQAKSSTQVLARDSHAYYMTVLALIGSTLEKIATEIRHLSRNEIGEVSEAFGKNQKGSSAMPQKKNPISSENICGCSRVLRGYLTPAFENINLWHERDISHSSAERIIFEDATTLLDYMLNRYEQTLLGLVVNEKRMIENISFSFDTLYSQRVMTKLIDKGQTREDAYDLTQRLTKEAFNVRQSFKTLLLKEGNVTMWLNQDEIEACFTNDYYLKQIDYIFNRVFS